VWLDALLMNVDRTIRNTNMLLWQKELWLIDHGAALYFHHSWNNPAEQALRPFVNIKDHVLLPVASRLQEADEWMKQKITTDMIAAVVNSIPDAFLQWDESLTPESIRKGYYDFIIARLSVSSQFVKEAIDARATII
jgi:hypothetical protein